MTFNRFQPLRGFLFSSALHAAPYCSLSPMPRRDYTNQAKKVLKRNEECNAAQLQAGIKAMG